MPVHQNFGHIDRVERSPRQSRLPSPSAMGAAFDLQGLHQPRHAPPSGNYVNAAPGELRERQPDQPGEFRERRHVENKLVTAPNGSSVAWVDGAVP
jgi:hypothetical protein